MTTNNPIPWRFIPLMVASGQLQMAIDAWLLQQHLKENHPPTLRFYRFDPVTISLGSLQRTYPSHWDTLQWQNQPIDLVYRPTGGRGVLHSGDLCYSIITSNIKGKRSEIYQYLCEFLIQGWRTFGLDLFYGKAGRGYIHNASCFGTATNADLVDSWGNKFIGSALRCSGKGILQQGSIQLATDPNLFKTVFSEIAPKPQFSGSLDDPTFLETAIATLTEAACQCFNIEFFSEPLSNDELKLIRDFNP
ncbi:biotin/lipoate A/B protein ligase family protein [Crocosphaera sp. UHCC 0190]|uniref:biotin/lipoate A/B protein ligase family protein n=1 Tax=Crocosphaera sp. UHCC 0190 TaxID=3110246 RepID=UPI002B1EED89|nr:biotin/lipoate A/B protein ligase family protein [Crocosphaera sp. UHCC 0190]MEA5512143.1 biotin/lipoate A/B protein ligase family protein [Crocosphaera sp. UHCC 0190]